MITAPRGGGTIRSGRCRHRFRGTGLSEPGKRKPDNPVELVSPRSRSSVQTRQASVGTGTSSSVNWIPRRSGRRRTKDDQHRVAPAPMIPHEHSSGPEIFRACSVTWLTAEFRTGLRGPPPRSVRPPPGDKDHDQALPQGGVAETIAGDLRIEIDREQDQDRSADHDRQGGQDPEPARGEQAKQDGRDHGGWQQAAPGSRVRERGSGAWPWPWIRPTLRPWSPAANQGEGTRAGGGAGAVRVPSSRAGS